MKKIEERIVVKIESLIDLLVDADLDNIEKARIKGMIQALENVLIMMNRENENG